MEAEIKAQFTLIIMSWIRRSFTNDIAHEFPLDIIQLLVNIFLYENIKILKWHQQFKSPSILLTDDDKCAHRKRGNGWNPYVMVDDEPATSIAVWRIKVCQLHFSLQYSIKYI